MQKKTLLIIGGVGLLLCCICVAVVGTIAAVGGFAAFSLTEPPVKAGDAFMTALKEGKFAQAYRLCSSDLQDELGSEDDLEFMIVDNRVQPVEWTFNSRNIEGDEAYLEGGVTFTGARKGSVSLSLTTEGGDWKISGFNLSED